MAHKTKRGRPCGFPRHDFELVGARGFEPPTPASRKQCSTRLSYAPARVSSGGLEGPAGLGKGQLIAPGLAPHKPGETRAKPALCWAV